MGKATASPQRELPSRDDVLLTRSEVAEILGVTLRWVDEAHRRGYFGFVKVGKLRRWRRSDIDAYVEAQSRPVHGKSGA